MPDVIVIDYGMGNIKSVQRGLEKVGASVKVSACPDSIAVAERLLLPGVGAFEDGMNGLRNAGLIHAINEFVKTGRPMLGICLGMQMLLEKSEEHGLHDGLGYISGTVKEVPRQDKSGEFRKIPHIGWNVLHNAGSRYSWKDTLLEDTVEGEFFYFVHSYMAVPNDEIDLLAQCEYEGVSVTAAVQRDNITGIQFHPEKSCGNGLRILKKFITS